MTARHPLLLHAAKLIILIIAELHVLGMIYGLMTRSGDGESFYPSQPEKTQAYRVMLNLVSTILSHTLELA